MDTNLVNGLCIYASMRLSIYLCAQVEVGSLIHIFHIFHIFHLIHLLCMYVYQFIELLHNGSGENAESADCNLAVPTDLNAFLPVINCRAYYYSFLCGWLALKSQLFF